MGWHDAEKILPPLNGRLYGDCRNLEESDPVLLYGLSPSGRKTWGIGTYVFDYDDETGEWSGVSLDEYDVYYCTITHWAELPSAPDVEKKGLCDNGN
jgi:hypothetical protein